MEALSAVVAAPALEEISIKDAVRCTDIRNGMMIADMIFNHVIFRSVGVRLYGMGEEISAKREIAREDDSEIKFAYTEFFGNLFQRLSTMNNETSHIEEF